jgi:hypothetical protein
MECGDVGSAGEALKVVGKQGWDLGLTVGVRGTFMRIGEMRG